MNDLPENRKFYQNTAGYRETLTSRKPDLLLKSENEDYLLFEADYLYAEILSHIADLRIYGIYNENTEIKIAEYNIIWYSKGPSENWDKGCHSDELQIWKELLSGMLPQSVNRCYIYFFQANSDQFEKIQVK